MKLNYDAKGMAALLPRIYSEFAKYRSTLLFSNKKNIANFSALKNINYKLSLSTSTATSLANFSFLNLYDTLDQLNNCGNEINNEIRSYVQGVTCSLYPLQLHFYDLFALVPDFIPSSAYVLQYQNALDLRLSTRESQIFPEGPPTLQPIAGTFNFGLHSFSYSNGQPIFSPDIASSVAEILQQFSSLSLQALKSEAEKPKSGVSILGSTEECLPIQLCLALLLSSIARALFMHIHSATTSWSEMVKITSTHLNYAKVEQCKNDSHKLKEDLKDQQSKLTLLGLDAENLNKSNSSNTTEKRSISDQQKEVKKRIDELTSQLGVVSSQLLAAEHELTQSRYPCIYYCIALEYL